MTGLPGWAGLLLLLQRRLGREEEQERERERLRVREREEEEAFARSFVRSL